MKSITQESSSLSKAIELAWQKAEKPKNFSIKVFQEPVKNFIGMTTQQAKIGLFFEEKQKPKKEYRTFKNDRNDRKVYKKQLTTDDKKPTAAAQKTRPIVEEPSERPTSAPRKENEPRTFWSDEMATFSKDWLNNTLKLMNLGNISYESKVINNQLRILFEKPLHNDEERERQLYRSFSLLMLQSLRHHLKRPLRGFKVVLLSTSDDSQ